MPYNLVVLSSIEQRGLRTQNMYTSQSRDVTSFYQLEACHNREMHIAISLTRCHIAWELWQ